MTCPFRAIAFAAAIVAGNAVPALAQAPAAPPAQEAPQAPPPAPVQPQTDAFGEELTLSPKTIIFMKGSGTWDKAYETLVDAFKSLYAYLDKQGIKRAGPPMTIYTQADDTGFQFQAAVPVAEPPKETPSGDVGVGTSPAGRAFKFVHQGSYDSMDTTYEAITSFLDAKSLEAQDLFVEEYVTDPVSTPDDKLTVNVYVPVR